MYKKRERNENFVEYKIGDIVQTKKAHPCGTNKWEIVRTGIDFKLKCVGCGHIVTIERQKALKIIKKNTDTLKSNEDNKR